MPVELRSKQRASSVPIAQELILLDLESPQPHQTLLRGGVLAGTGWAITQTDVVQISVHLNETFLCNARCNLPRSDIAERFPHFVRAARSGFSFVAPLEKTAEATAGSMQDSRIVLQVYTASGAEVRREVPVTLAAAPSHGENVEGQHCVPELDPVHISIETARIDHDAMLHVGGWIVSNAPASEVLLALGGSPLGAPELGLERPDIAAAYPGYANARWSGFRLVQDVGNLIGPQDLVRVCAEFEDGVRRQILAPVEKPRLRQAAESSIHLSCQSFVVHSNGKIDVSGWAVSASGIRTIEVGFDGAPIGEAWLGQSRPDIGNRFPRIPSARNSGFRFIGALPGSVFAEHLLTIRAWNCIGEAYELDFPLRVEDVCTDQPHDAAIDQAKAIHFNIDAPAVRGDRALALVRGMLSIRGWAVARAGIAEVQVSVDEQPLGAAYYGIRREDIAPLFPDNKDALLSGFALTIPARLVGEHMIGVSIRSRSGESVEHRFLLQAVSADDEAGTLLPSRSPQAETDFSLLNLHRRGVPPRFLLLIRSNESGAKAAEAMQRTIDSLEAQAFPHWRIAVISSSGGSVSSAIPQLNSASKFRDRIVNRSELKTLLSGSGSAPTFLLVLNAGDRLRADALLEFALETILNGETDFIYADERRYDPSLRVTAPWFKPDWSPDLLLSTNYIGRAWCASDELRLRAGITERELSAATDYDLVLRLTETASRIAHIPKLLAEQADSPIQNAAEEKRALMRAAGRRGLSVQILPGLAPATYRLKPRSIARDLVSIIVPTCGARDLFEATLRSLRELTDYPAIEIVGIDNIPNENAGAKIRLRAMADRVVETAEPFNWSRFNNMGASVATGRYLLFLNDDMEVRDPNWLEALLEQAVRPEVGVVGPLLVYPGNTIQHAGIFLDGSTGRHAFRFAPADHPGAFGQALTLRNVIAVTGACMLMRRQTFDALGGFDEAHLVINNDLDFCLRSWRAGLRVVYTPFARLLHHELASRKEMPDIFDEHRFATAWRSRIIEGDPFFNPNLSTRSEHYEPDSEPIELPYTGSPVISREKVRRILIVKLDHIGDFVLALPAIRRLKERFPQATLTLLGTRASRSLASLDSSIAEFLEFEFFRERSDMGTVRVTPEQMRTLEQQLRSRRFDIAIDLRMQKETRHILLLAGASVLAGFEHQGSFPWLHVGVEWEGDARELPKRMHVSNRLLQLVEAVAIACDTARPQLQPAASDRAAIQGLRRLLAAGAPAGFSDRPLVCVHPTAGSVMKQWPAASFAALVDLLVAEEGVNVLLIGADDDTTVVEQIIGQLAKPSAAFSLVGQVGLSELPSVLQACCLFVGNDSGPKHIAAALGVPTVGIHSSRVDPIEWGPLGDRAVAIRRRVSCGPCYALRVSDCHRDLFCIRSIRPIDVFRACQRMLRLAVRPQPRKARLKSATIADTSGNSPRGSRVGRQPSGAPISLL